MRVIIIAATQQKAAIADKLVQHENLSKILLNQSSFKLVTQAQAIIIYFESKKDLAEMSNLLQIYSGCPLKFYFGQKRYKDFQHFYHFSQADQLVNDLFTELQGLAKNAEVIYDQVLIKNKEDNKVTVKSMLDQMVSKNAIQDQCIEFFSKDKKVKKDTDDKSGSNVVVDRKKFRDWFIEAKSDHFETIKYYLIGWMSRQIKGNKLDAETAKKIAEFNSYKMKRKQINEMKRHYENTFNLNIEGTQVVPAVKEETKKAGGTKQLAEKLLKVKADKAESQPGTQIDARCVFFPDFEKDEKVQYYKSLHNFDEDNGWVSFGFKPKAKDLKTFLEDLYEFDYFDSLEEESDTISSIVLDGRKVRIGFESKKFDIFNEESGWGKRGRKSNRSDEKDFIELIQVHEQDKDNDTVQQAIFDFNISFGKSLSDILSSMEPLIVGLFKQMKIQASLKFHAKQFAQVLESTTECKYHEYYQPKNAGKEVKKDEEAAKEGEAAEHKEESVNEEEARSELSDKKSEEEQEKQSEKEATEENESKKEGEDEEDEEAEDEDKESEEEEDEDDYGENDDDEDEDDDDDENNGADKGDVFGLKNIFKTLLPFFLFQWNSRIKMQPDLDDLREFCKDNKELSLLYQSYKEIITKLKDIDISTILDHNPATIKKGSKAEVLHYLIQEVGKEIEFAWKTKYFYIAGQIKTEDLGNVIKLLSKGELI